MPSKGHKSNKLFNMRGGEVGVGVYVTLFFTFGVGAIVMGFICTGKLKQFKTKIQTLFASKIHPDLEEIIKDITILDYLKESKDLNYKFYDKDLRKLANAKIVFQVICLKLAVLFFINVIYPFIT